MTAGQVQSGVQTLSLQSCTLALPLLCLSVKETNILQISSESSVSKYLVY